MVWCWIRALKFDKKRNLWIVQVYPCINSSQNVNKTWTELEQKSNKTWINLYNYFVTLDNHIALTFFPGFLLHYFFIFIVLCDMLLY